MLILTFIRLYKYHQKDSDDYTTMFVYSVSGDAGIIHHYCKNIGPHIRLDEDSGDPLFFSQLYLGRTVSLTGE